MPTIIALSPHFPSNFSRFWTELKACGAKVLGISDTPWDELSSELKNSLDEYWRVEDMHNLDEMFQACLTLQERHGTISHIESHNEYWLETEAQLRSRLGVPGPNQDTIALLKRKSQMQEVYRQASIPVPPGTLASSLQACQDLIAETGFPVVAKPDIGVGAAQTFKISSQQELEDFWQHKPSVDYFLQGFVAGQLYSFDGLANARGDILFMASHRFSNGIMEVVNQDLDLSYCSLREIPTELIELGQKAVAAFQIRERFFHFEFFQQPDGQWLALEVNMRPPGGLTVDMFNFANDIDVQHAYAELITTGKVQLQAERPYHCAFASRKHRHYQLSHEEILSQFAQEIVYHGPMAEIFYPVMGHSAYLFRHPDEARVMEIIQTIQRQA